MTRRRDTRAEDALAAEFSDLAGVEIDTSVQLPPAVLALTSPKDVAGKDATAAHKSARPTIDSLGAELRKLEEIIEGLPAASRMFAATIVADVAAQMKQSAITRSLAAPSALSELPSLSRYRAARASRPDDAPVPPRPGAAG